MDQTIVNPDAGETPLQIATQALETILEEVNDPDMSRWLKIERVSFLAETTLDKLEEMSAESEARP